MCISSCDNRIRPWLKVCTSMNKERCVTEAKCHTWCKFIVVRLRVKWCDRKDRNGITSNPLGQKRNRIKTCSNFCSAPILFKCAQRKKKCEDSRDSNQRDTYFKFHMHRL